MNLDVTTFHSTPDALFAAHRDVFIVVWRTDTTQTLVRALGRHVERFSASHREGIAMIVIIEENCAMPDSATREVLATDMKKHESFTKQMALVYEGTGFRAAALRSIVVGLHMLSRQRVPTKVVSTVDEGVAWLGREGLGVAIQKARGR